MEKVEEVPLVEEAPQFFPHDGGVEKVNIVDALLFPHGEKEEVVDDLDLSLSLGRFGLVLHLPVLSDFPICSLSLDRPVENRDVSGRTREGGRTEVQCRGTEKRTVSVCL